MDEDLLNQKPERLTKRRIAESVVSILNLERGLFYTLKKLAIRPGKTIRTYLFEDRRKIIEPTRFLLVMVALLYISFQYTNEDEDMANGLLLSFVDGYNQSFEELSSTYEGESNEEKKIKEPYKDVWQKSDQYFTLIIAFFVPVVALFSKILFHKSEFNSAEHLAINAYTMGFNCFLFAIITIISAGATQLADIKIYIWIAFFLYVYYQLFSGKWYLLLCKSLMTYLLAVFFYVMGLFIFLVIVKSLNFT